MTSCLLFDCDGTLVDSERLGNVALAQTFAPLGISLDPDRLTLRFRGWKLALILDILAAENNVELGESFVSDYRIRARDLFESELTAIPGVEQALQALPQPKAVVSSGPLQKIRQTLRVTGLDKYFEDNLYSSYDIGIWKPDPDIYRHAAHAMGYRESECAVIDDGRVGIEAGSNAGIKTYFFNRFEELCDIPGVTMFHSMSELPTLLLADKQRQETDGSDLTVGCAIPPMTTS